MYTYVMTFEEYQKQAMETALEYGEQTFNYGGLGLVGEAGEIANKLKKVIREHDGKIPEGLDQDLKKELGDVLWYINFLSVKLGLSLEEVAQANLTKLASRKERGTLLGNGDDR